MLATVVLLVLTATLSDAAFLSWGWRVAFWLSAVVVLVGYYIRTKVTDAPIFLEAQQEIERVKATSYGVVEVLKRYPRGVFTAMGLRFAENIMYYLVVILLDRLPQGAGRCRPGRILLRCLLVAHACTSSSSRSSAGWPTASAAGRSTWSARCSRATWGFFAFPMMDTRQLPAHHRRHHHRPGHPRAHVRAAAGDHGRDVPDPDAVFRCLPWLSGHLDRRRIAGADHRRQAARHLRLLGADRDLPGRGLRWSPDRGVFIRETKGIDLATVDQADRERPRQGRRRMTDLNGRTALVTGGASGIGAAVRRELAARGAVVTVADVDDVGAKALADEIGGKAWAVDLLDVGALEDLQPRGRHPGQQRRRPAASAPSPNSRPTSSGRCSP